jgi:hypothetical protein
LLELSCQVTFTSEAERGLATTFDGAATVGPPRAKSGSSASGIKG